MKMISKISANEVFIAEIQIWRIYNGVLFVFLLVFGDGSFFCVYIRVTRNIMIFLYSYLFSVKR